LAGHPGTVTKGVAESGDHRCADVFHDLWGSVLGGAVCAFRDYFGAGGYPAADDGVAGGLCAAPADLSLAGANGGGGRVLWRWRDDVARRAFQFWQLRRVSVPGDSRRIS